MTPKIESGLTRAECKKAGFSGIRYCPHMDQYEIWLLGEIKAEVSNERVQADYRALPNEYERVFGFHPGTITSGKP